MLKIKYIFILISFFSCTMMSCFSDRAYYQDIINIETEIVKKNDNVQSAEVLYDYGNWGERKLYLLITFKNDKYLILSNVTEEQNNIRIESINGYELFLYARLLDENNNAEEKLKDILFDSIGGYRIYYHKALSDGNYNFYSAYKAAIDRVVVGNRLNLNQLIQNFDKMETYINNLEDISSEQFRGKSIDWFWSDEANLKKIMAEDYERIDFKIPEMGTAIVRHPPYTKAKEKWRKRLMSEHLPPN